MEEIKQNTVYLYAEYKINGVKKCQIIKSGNVNDLIYEEGMKEVCFKKLIFNGNSIIDCTQNPLYYSIGVPITNEDYIKMYNDNNPRIVKNEDIYSYVIKNNNKRKLILLPNRTIAFRHYDNCINPKKEESPQYIQPDAIIKGNNKWYIELHNGDKITYEETYLGDKLYRGQECDYYSFVLVCEYEIEGNKKKDIILREDKKYPKNKVEFRKVDSIIDKAKTIIANEYSFSGFHGVSPLYRYNSEDSACVFQERKSSIKNKNVITVTGSGDANLDLFMNGANKIVSFDSNELTPFWAELKFIAAKHLKFEDYLILINSLDYNIYSKISQYLKPDTKKLWDELYNFCKIKGINITDSQLFYHGGMFSAECTRNNPLGYCNETNYYRMQKSLKDKTIDDITFISCDIFDFPDKIKLDQFSYAYLSNIMDFIVGVDKFEVNENAMIKFKEFVLKILLPSMKKDSTIDLCYIDKEWHTGINDSLYYDLFIDDEGFSITNLSNDKASILTYNPFLKDIINYYKTQITQNKTK